MVMPNQAHALARDELIRVLTAYKGITTANGAVGGNTLIDSNLIGANDFVTDKTVLIMFGNAINETKAATVFNPATGAITVDPAFNAQIIIGTPFRILNIPAGSSLTIIIATITAIFALVNAILTLTETGGTLTTDGTEQTVYTNAAPAGVFEPLMLQIDCTNLALGQTIVIRSFYQINPAGALIPSEPLTIVGPRDPEFRLVNIPLPPNRFGYEVTLEQIVGAVGITYDWGVIYRI